MKVEINAFGKSFNCLIKLDQYANGRTAVILIDARDGSPFGTLTVNVSNVALEDGEMLVKTWSENESWWQQVVDAHPDVFHDTKRKVQVGFGFTTASVFRFEESCHVVFDGKLFSFRYIHQDNYVDMTPEERMAYESQKVIWELADDDDAMNRLFEQARTNWDRRC